AQPPRPTVAGLGASPAAQVPSVAKRAAAAAPPSEIAKKPSAGKKIAAAISVIIFAGLSAAAFIVIRGPGKGPQQQQTASDISSNPVVPVATPTQAPNPGQTLQATAPAPTLTPVASLNKNTAKEEAKKETPAPTPKPTEDATRHPKNLPDNPPVALPPPVPQPTPTVIRPIEEPDNESGTCLIVIVTGPGGGPASGVRLAVTDEPSLYQGVTGPNGRWRRCGLMAGHRVTVRVFKGGTLLGTKQDVLTAGRNFIGIQVQAQLDPYTDLPRPGRKPNFWQRRQ